MHHHNAVTGLLLFAAAILAARGEPAPTINTAFSPRGGCAALTEQQIDSATTSLDVTAYQFTQARLIQATIRARTRGVAVRVIIDRAQETAPAHGPDAARRGAIDIRTDAAEKLHHNKYVIIDGATVITGSYNWSDNAEQSNAENLVVIHDTTTAAAFAADFAKHWAHCRPFSIHQPRRRLPKGPQAASPTLHPPATKGFLSWHEFTDPYIPTRQAAPWPAPSPSLIGRGTAPTYESA
jgi:phosphatidylserine/phosphatidylglycerophosphate/cardiolipin synthase-like enzyme